MKFAWINGRLIRAATARISIFDRGFMYGDGLFETLRVSRGEPHLWDAHWERFSRGAEVLRIELAYDSRSLRKQAEKLLKANKAPDAVLRIHLSRGVGSRGYSPTTARTPILVMSTHPLPETPKAWKLATTSYRLPPTNALSAVKTSNKLLHVLAKAEAECKGADEGLLLTHSGDVAQGTASNLFWIEGHSICTAPEQAGILPGVTRAAVLRACERLKIPVRQTTVQPDKLHAGAGVFMTLSTFGIVEAASLDGRDLPHSPFPAELRNALEKSG